MLPSVHARMEGGKCVCEPQWKGPICNEHETCPDGQARVGKQWVLPPDEFNSEAVRVFAFLGYPELISLSVVVWCVLRTNDCLHRCIANVCQHGGTLAVGRKEIECICEVGILSLHFSLCLDHIWLLHVISLSAQVVSNFPDVTSIAFPFKSATP